MNARKLIGKVSATEKCPSSCDEFQFWLSDDAILSPFDIVLVENKQTIQLPMVWYKTFSILLMVLAILVTMCHLILAMWKQCQ